MKTNSITFVMAILMGLSLLFSCKQDANTTENSEEDANTEEVTEEPEAPRDVMYVIHEVNDYDAWKPGFDEHVSARTESGVHTIGVARDQDNPNEIHLSFFIDDIEQAKAFAGSDELKAKMEEVGVVGPPNIRYFKFVNLEAEPTEITQRVMVTHEVAEFDAWKQAYDENKPARDEAGLQERALLREIGNENNVLMVFAYSDRANVEEMLASDELAEAMKNAGVTGELTIDYINWEELDVN